MVTTSMREPIAAELRSGRAERLGIRREQMSTDEKPRSSPTVRPESSRYGV
jgi:hypothetical protein